MKDTEAREQISNIARRLENEIDQKLNKKIYLKNKDGINTFITISGSPFGYPIPDFSVVEVDVVELLESILDYLNLDVVPRNTKKTFTLVERGKE